MPNQDKNDGSQEQPPQRASVHVAVRRAAEQLSSLLGEEPESVSSLQPRDEGWVADLEVVEIQRIPDTSSVMATYRVTLNPQGELLGYEQTRRYARGQIDRA